MRRLLLWVKRLLVGALCLVFFVLLGALVALRIPAVQTNVASTVSSLASADPDVFSLELEGLAGGLPFDLELDRVVLGDVDGPWLVIEDLQFAWSPLAGLTGTIAIDRVAAEALRVLRIPAAQPDEDEEETTEPFDWREDLPSLRISELRINDLELKEPVVGVEARYVVEGHTSIGDWAQTVLRLALQTRGEEGKGLVLDLSTTDQPLSFEGELTLKEGPQGLVVALVDDASLESIEAGLTIHGPLEALDLALVADLKGMVNANLSGQLNIEEPAFGGVLKGQVEASTLISDALGRPVDGPALLRVDFDFDPLGEFVLEELELALSGTTLRSKGSAAWGEQAFRTDFSLDAEGALLPALTGETVESVAATLTAGFEGGSGQGDLNAEIGGVGDLSLTLKSDDMRSGAQPFRLSGSGEFGALFEKLIGRRVSDRLGLDASGRWSAGKQFVLDKGDLRFGEAILNATADIDLAGLGGEVQLELTQSQDASFARLLDPLGIGSLQFKGKAANLAGQGTFGATLGGKGLRFEDHRVASLGVNLHGQFTEADFGALTANLELDLSGAQTAEGPLVAIGSTLELVADASVDLEGGAAEVTKFVVTSPGVVADGVFAATDQWSGFSADLDLTMPTLVYLEPIVGSELEGQGRVTVEGAFDANTENAHADVDFTLAKLSFADPVLSDLLGSEAKASVAVQSSADGVVVEALEANARGILVHGNATLKDDFSQLDAKLSALVGDEVPELAGRDLAFKGGLRLDLDAEGPLEALKATIHAKAHDLVFGPSRISGLVVDADAFTQGQGGGAALQATLSTPKGPLELVGAVSLDDRGAWLVDGLRLKGAGTDAEVALRGDLETSLVNGTILANLEDLSAFNELSGIPLAGSLSLDAGLVGDADTGQDLTLDLKTVSLRTTDADGAPVVFDDLVVTAALRDVLGRPGGELSAKLQGLDSAELTLPELSFKANSRGDTWDLWLDTSLERPQALVLSTAAAVEGLPAPTVVRVSKLEFTALDTALALEAPFAVQLGDTLRVDGLRLAIEGGGLVSVDGRFDPEDLGAKILVEELPLGLLQLLDPTLRFDGLAGLVANVDGTAAKPVVSAEFHIDGLSNAQLAKAEFRPLGISGLAELAKGRLDAKLDLEGFKQTAMTLSAKLPVSDQAAGTGMEVAIDGDLELGALAKLLPIGDDVVRGRLVADVVVGGSMSLPTVHGSLKLKDGYFESAAAGTVLEQLEVEAVGEGSRIVLAKLEASDGGEGSIGGEGFFELGRLPGWDFEFSLLMDDATLTRLDVATARAGGSVTIRGSKDEAKPANMDLRGRVELERVEVNIPGRFAADVTQLEVRELNNGVPIAEEAPADTGAATVKLDLRVAADNRIYVKGRGLESEWRTGLFIEGTAAEPEIQGKVSVVRGTMALLGKDFDLSKGNIAFAGAANNEPDLDIRAETEAGEITAFVDVTGTPSNIAIAFSSDPALPRSEVLAYVLFGEGADELTPLQSVKLAQSLASLSGRGGGPGVFDALGKGLGLDKIGVGGEGLTAGKYLTEDVYLNVQQGLTPESSKVGIEWEVTDSIRVESDVGQDAGGEVGLSWQFDY